MVPAVGSGFEPGLRLYALTTVLLPVRITEVRTPVLPVVGTVVVVAVGSGLEPTLRLYTFRAQ